MADRRDKRRRGKYKNMNILGREKAFQMKGKTFFIISQGLSFDEKKKNEGLKL